MSGIIPDLASWALRGGAGNEGEEADATDEAANEPSRNEELTEEVVRARRLARIEALQSQQQVGQDDKKDEKNEAEPMDIDKPVESETSAPMEIQAPVDDKKPAANEAPAPPTSPTSNSDALSKEHKKRKVKENRSPGDHPRKVNRKKELLLKKVLLVTLAGGTTDSSCVVVNIDSNEVTAQNISEILATRLYLPASSSELRTIPSQKPLIPYLGQCHRRASEEIKSLKQASKNKSPELLEILEEIKVQVVNYAASCLLVAGLFELASDSSLQLAKALVASVTDLSTSITFGVTDSTSSFYHCLCEEMCTQDKEQLQGVVTEIVAYLTEKLSKCDSVLDGEGDGSGIVLVSALKALCSHKQVAEMVTNLPNFLLPEAGTTEAVEIIRPPMLAGANLLRMLTGENRPYLKRSGPALDKKTILGLCLRLGTPSSNPAFSPGSILRQSLHSVEQTNSSQRRQLRVHQEACNQLVMALIRGGHDARGKVMKWVVDALLMNNGASALRPDTTKVSSNSTLLNALAIMLKLCEPFVAKESKHSLIEANFVSSPKDHGGVFVDAGDDAVPRLGEPGTGAKPYNPKNSFIPQCFFFTARLLNLSLVPQLSSHENLLRHISHLHMDLTSRNRDISSDTHFTVLLAKQRSNEVALFQEELITDALRFCNLMSRILYGLDEETLGRMPEHFVNNTCDILMSIAKIKPKLLQGLEFRYVFKLVVKLLSPTFSSMIRNYNLRAMLGDALYELYLPSGTDDKREVPSSVSTDPLAGGQTFLLSDPLAQDTLAPSLLLLYGEVEHTGYYDRMSHRAKIASLIKYLWESKEHRPAFRQITQNKESFVKFANGIMNETNTLIATVMQKLPEIREVQIKMKNTEEWNKISEDERNVLTSRLDDNEREVKHALPLCNKTLQMFGYLNTDASIRALFLLEELCPRLVTMLLHVLTKLVGSKGLDLKVDNPEQYEFRPKEMLRDLCAIFALFAHSEEFQLQCAKSGCDPNLLSSAIKTCRKFTLLTGESMTAFEELPDLVKRRLQSVAADEALLADAPDEFLDEILSTFMKDPVRLPSGHFVDRSTITQHLLNDPTDPFNRKKMTVDDIVPATELKAKMEAWVEEKKQAHGK